MILRKPRSRSRVRSARLWAATEPLEPRLLLTSVVVNTAADVIHAQPSTVVSLRDAINIANKSTTPTTITFDPQVFATAKKIGLNPHPLELTARQPVTITGPAVGVTVNGENNTTDFIIDKGVTATFAGLTIAGGNNFTHTSDSGGVINNGALTLKAVTVTGNENFEGGSGGIYNGGTLVITSSTVSNNVSGFNSNGGGIDNAGTLAIANSTVSNNTTGSFGDGGGIENEAGANLTVTDSTISGNTSDSSGGLENHGNAALIGVTLSNNAAQGGADPGGGGPGVDGGIGNFGKLTVTNCTIAGNSDGYLGGGIGNHDMLTLSNSTIAGNSAGGGAFLSFEGPGPASTPVVGAGGGLYVDPHSKYTIIENTIIAGNQVINGTGPDVFGAAQSFGYNLIGQTNGSSGWRTTDRTGTAAHPLDPRLSPLASFGGPTQTIVPLSGSPAIDHGSNLLVPAGLTTDQRGLPRIASGTVDIGAVEVQPSAAHFVVTARANLTATEGMSYSLSPASFTETGATGPYTADVDWGDGTPDSVFSFTSPGALPRVPHIFAGEGTYHGTVTVFDATGHNSAATPFTVKVAR